MELQCAHENIWRMDSFVIG